MYKFQKPLYCINDAKKRFFTKKAKEKYMFAVMGSIKELPEDIIKNITKEAFDLKGITFCKCNEINTCYLCRVACCEDAVGVYCMCMQRTKCIKHGDMCYGSHD